MRTIKRYFGALNSKTASQFFASKASLKTVLITPSEIMFRIDEGSIKEDEALEKLVEYHRKGRLDNNEALSSVRTINRIPSAYLLTNDYIDGVFDSLDDYSFRNFRFFDEMQCKESLTAVIKLNTSLNTIFTRVIDEECRGERFSEGIDFIFEKRRAKSTFVQALVRAMLLEGRFERMLTMNEIIKPSLRARLLELKNADKDTVSKIRAELKDHLNTFTKKIVADKILDRKTEVIKPISWRFEEIMSCLPLLFEYSLSHSDKRERLTDLDTLISYLLGIMPDILTESYCLLKQELITEMTSDIALDNISAVVKYLDMPAFSYMKKTNLDEYTLLNSLLTSD